MDSFEFNKIAGGILAALLVLMAVRIIGEGIYEVEPLEKAAYAVPGVVAEAEPAGGAAPAAAGPSFEEALAKADPKKGQTISHKCQTCHSIEKGGANKIGPDLWGVVGRPVASHEGFSYSDAVKKIGGNWTFDKIEHFITSPRSFAPGTKMTFAGLPDAQDRADVLAYLNTQSDSPLPIPKPEAKPAAAPAPAGGATPPANGAAPAAPPANGNPAKQGDQPTAPATQSDTGATSPSGGTPAPAAGSSQGSGSATPAPTEPPKEGDTHAVH